MNITNYYNSQIDRSLKAEFTTNPPVTIKGRPSNNNVKIRLRDLTGAISEKEPAFLLILRFEKIKKEYL